MLHLPKSPPDTLPDTLPDSASDVLVLNLTRAPDGDLAARSVVLANDVYHTRVNVKGDPPITKVFAPPFLRKLQELIARAGTKDRMFMSADFVIELEHLMLKGCRVMVTAAKDGLDHIMVRFKSVMGRLNAIFNPDYSLPQLRDTLEDELSNGAMQDVLMPLFNFAAHIDMLLDDDKLPWLEKGVLTKVKQEIAKLEYSSDLLGYLVSSRDISSVPSRRDPQPTGPRSRLPEHS